MLWGKFHFINSLRKFLILWMRSESSVSLSARKICLFLLLHLHPPSPSHLGRTIPPQHLILGLWGHRDETRVLFICLLVRIHAMPYSPHCILKEAAMGTLELPMWCFTLTPFWSETWNTAFFRAQGYYKYPPWAVSKVCPRIAHYPEAFLHITVKLKLACWCICQCQLLQRHH